MNFLGFGELFSYPMMLVIAPANRRKPSSIAVSMLDSFFLRGEKGLQQTVGLRRFLATRGAGSGSSLVLVIHQGNYRVYGCGRKNRRRLNAHFCKKSND